MSWHPTAARARAAEAYLRADSGWCDLLASDAEVVNPLLDLLRARWAETYTLFGGGGEGERAWLPDLELLQDRPLEKGQALTLKGADPRSYRLMRKWRDACRDYPCHLFAYATPNRCALDVIAGHGPVLEVGAGTGYWAWCLRQLGADVVAVDTCPPEGGAANEYHGHARAWTQVDKGGPAMLARYPSRTLLLCYPPPDSEMALECLQVYTGEVVLYVGEWRGDCATAGFHRALVADFRLTRRVRLPNWGNTSYELTCWTRTKGGGGGSVIGPVPCCSQCAGAGSRLRRCRLTYDVIFCSPVRPGLPQVWGPLCARLADWALYICVASCASP